jgi:hypothetical protein
MGALLWNVAWTRGLLSWRSTRFSKPDLPIRRLKLIYNCFRHFLSLCFIQLFHVPYGG